MPNFDNNSLSYKKKPIKLEVTRGKPLFTIDSESLEYYKVPVTINTQGDLKHKRIEIICVITNDSSGEVKSKRFPIRKVEKTFNTSYEIPGPGSYTYGLLARPCQEKPKKHQPVN